MNIDNYNSILQSLLEERSNILYNAQRSQNQLLILNNRLNKVDEAIEELKRKKDEYIGNRESDY